MHGRQATATHGDKPAVTSWLQTLDTNSFYARTQASVSHCDKCLNVNGDDAEARCIPSATHVPRKHWNQDTVLGTFVTKFMELPCVRTQQKLQIKTRCRVEYKRLKTETLQTEQARFNKFSKHVHKAAIWSIDVHSNIRSVHNSLRFSCHQADRIMQLEQQLHSELNNFLSSSNVQPGSGAHPAD